MTAPAADLKPGRALDLRVAELRGEDSSSPGWAPVCAVDNHACDELENDPLDGWSGWCYRCGVSVREVERVPPRYSRSDAAAVELARAECMTVAFDLGREVRVTCGNAHAAGDSFPLAVCAAFIAWKVPRVGITSRPPAGAPPPNVKR